MKKLISIALLSATTLLGQGTFIFDQQSSTDETPHGYGYGPQLSTLLPLTGQSFTPTLAGIDFVRLKFDDGAVGDGQGATLYLNLRSGSIGGTILGSTVLVNMPDGFTGTQTFFFPGTVGLTPGTTYYLELAVQSAFNWHVDAGPYNYVGGEAFANGNPWPAADYWFREGILVPEPGPLLLALIGGALSLFTKRHRACA